MGVRFPNEASLRILGDGGCVVDAATQVVRFPRDV
ncbi:MAG: hypothetical protein QG587_2140, partial [Chloroflexota bacterium]|nr:hypothetical protein [Chloroflexota bacterium]